MGLPQEPIPTHGGPGWACLASPRPADGQCPVPGPSLSTGPKVLRVEVRMSGRDEEKEKAGWEADLPQSQEKQKGGHQGCHGDTVAQVVDNQGDTVVQVILPLLDRQTQETGHELRVGAGHSSHAHPCVS